MALGAVSAYHGVMIYQIEIIRDVEGRGEPEVLQRANQQADSIELVKAQATALFTSTRLLNPATGVRIIENGERIVWSYRAVDDA